MSTETNPTHPIEASVPLSALIAWQNEEIAEINAQLEKVKRMREIAATREEDVSREAENQQFKIRGRMEELHGLTAFLSHYVELASPEQIIDK